MIAGQSPRIQWKVKPNGEVRTIEDAVRIAAQNGIVIPEDVSFSIDVLGDLGQDWTACGPRVDKPDGAIVGVLAHEMYELEELRPLLLQGDVSIGRFIGMTCPGNPGNLHDEA